MKTKFIAVILITVLLAGHLECANIDPGNRWQVRDYFRSVYLDGTAASIGWSGNYSNGVAGRVSDEWQKATLNRVNFYRNMTGIPGSVTFDPTLSAAAQQTALMMSAESRISHTPGEEWAWYTAEGAAAAGRSNLALGPIGPDAIDGYISDFGQYNTNVGHRRWIFYPSTQVMGSGDVPGENQLNLPPANALWVIPETMGSRPTTRDQYIAWPPRGHVPAELVFARWSFALPAADFTEATVSMTTSGQTIPLMLEPYDGRSIGDPTLVWVPNGMNPNTKTHWPIPRYDQRILVEIRNVLMNGSYQDFSYDVIIFDSEQAGSQEYPTVATTAGPVIPNIPTTFEVTSREWSEGVQGRIIQAQTYTEDKGAENGLIGMKASLSDGYTGFQNERVASGSSAYHLTTPDTQPQILELEGEYVIWPQDPLLSFESSLAWATPIQVASVEINTGSGDNWYIIWSQNGDVEDNMAFTFETIDLSAWAGKTARFRFRYALDNLGGYWANTEPSFGWAVDNISFTDVSRVSSIEELPPEMGSRSIQVTAKDTNRLYLQVRDIAFDGTPLDWGPINEINPVSHHSVTPVIGQWSEDSIIGWNFGGDEGWTFSLNFGWTNVEAFPWIFISEGWLYHFSGSMHSGVWFFHPEYGAIYASAQFGNWFLHEPYDANSWKQFGG